MKNVLSLCALVLAVLVIAGCNSAGESAAPAADLDLDNREQRVSYAQGFDLGRRGRGLPLEVDAFVAGVRAGITDAGALSDDEIQAALMDFQTFMSEAAESEGDANRRASDEFMAQNATREGVQTTASGLQYEVLREGEGPLPGPDATVTVHYRGTLLDGTEFDESYSGEPATFSVNGVIPGFGEGVRLMNVGAKYRIYVPTDLGYGLQVRPGGAIKPNHALIFEIEMLGIS